MRYQHVAEFLNKEGMEVFSYDHQGHGRSEGDPAYVESFSDYADDFWTYVDSTFISRPELMKLPRFLIGHSMGGLVVCISMFRRQHYFTGVIFSGPLMQIDPKVATPVLVAASSYLSYLLPRLELDKLDGSKVSRDPEVVAKYNSDPLVYHGGLKARWGYSVMDHVRIANEQLHTITYPFLVMQGGQDALVPPEGARRLFERAASTKKALKWYDDLFHEIFNEKEKDQVFKDMIEWINKFY
jgi:acylglycerol lipase